MIKRAVASLLFIVACTSLAAGQGQGSVRSESSIGSALRVRSGQEEIGRALDEGLVVGVERRARQFFFELVGDAPAVETVLQTTAR